MSPRLAVRLSEIPDPRSSKHRLYPPEEILPLCIGAAVGGADGGAGIVECDPNKLPRLRRFLPFADGMPSADCLGRIMARLPQRSLRERFAAWTRSVARSSDGEVLAIDGETLRGSRDRRRDRRALHTVGAWASANWLSLGQLATDEKPNEIG